MPMNRHLYPDNWEEISHQIKFIRAGGYCEGSPSYPDCRARHGYRHPETSNPVVLATVHLGVPKPDGTPGHKEDKMDCRPENLASMCQRCHLEFDSDEHSLSTARTRRQKQTEAGQLELDM